MCAIPVKPIQYDRSLFWFFYVYFPSSIILGFISPHATLAYTYAFIGDIVGMAVLIKAAVVRGGNVAKLLNPLTQNNLKKRCSYYD